MMVVGHARRRTTKDSGRIKFCVDDGEGEVGTDDGDVSEGDHNGR